MYTYRNELIQYEASCWQRDPDQFEHFKQDIEVNQTFLPHVYAFLTPDAQKQFGHSAHHDAKQKTDFAQWVLADLYRLISDTIQERNHQHLPRLLLEQSILLYPLKHKSVKMIHSIDPYTPIPTGTIGQILNVDSMQTIHVRWESGNQLGIILGEDVFELVVDGVSS